MDPTQNRQAPSFCRSAMKYKRKTSTLHQKMFWIALNALNLAKNKEILKKLAKNRKVVKIQTHVLTRFSVICCQNHKRKPAYQGDLGLQNAGKLSKGVLFYKLTKN